MKTSFVIARYKEDLSWLRRLEGDIDINIFTKSSEPLDLDDRFKANITFMPNRGRESGTYLHFLSRIYVPGAADYIVFSQGDPFEHSPDFIRIVNGHKASWLPVQTLSLQWIEKKNDPPPRSDCEREFRVVFPSVSIKNGVVFPEYLGATAVLRSW